MGRHPRRHPVAAHGAGGLRLEVLDFLLRSDRTNAAIDRLHRAGQSYDPFLIFDLDRMSVIDFLALFREHKVAVEREAKRRGIEVPDPRDYVPFPRSAGWIVREWDD